VPSSLPCFDKTCMAIILIVFTRLLQLR
jgi:hypothetical protein